MRKHTELLSWFLLLPSLLLTGCREEVKYAKSLTPVKVQPVEMYRGTQGQAYSGNVEPLTRVDVVFRLGGYVEEILNVGGRLVQEGDSVSKNTVLAKLRQSDYTVKVDQAKSQLEQAQFAVSQAQEAVKGSLALRDKAQLDWERAGNLYGKQSLIKPDYDAARAQLDGYQAQLDANQAQAKLAQARVPGAEALVREADLAVQDSTLKAPLNAMVLKRLIELGVLVAPGTPAFIMGDVSQVKIVFGVPDTVLPSLKIGMTLPVTAEAVPGASFSGRVTRIAPTADPRTRVFEVELSVPNGAGRLKPGMIASLTLSGRVHADAVPVIPLAAVVQPPPGTPGYMVYVAGEQGGRAIVKARTVQLGDAVGDRIAVREGLRDGERVVVIGTSMVHDGDTVEIVP